MGIFTYRWNQLGEKRRHIISSAESIDKAKVLDFNFPDDIRSTLGYMDLIFEGVIDSLLKEGKSAKAAIEKSHLFADAKNRAPIR